MVQHMIRRSACCVLLPFTLVLSSCSGSASKKPRAKPPTSAAHVAVTIRVPEQFKTVQGAVAAAGKGDTILISPGIYREAVTVETDSLTIRGLDRNSVIFDGSFKKDNGILVAADDVVLENFTVRNYTVNGVFVTGDGDPDDPPGTDTAATTLRHYRMSYLTAHNNGLYGLYAFGAQDGVIEHVYASGNPDSGLYVGQCRPCRTLVQDATLEHNSIGFEATNAGGDLTVINSHFVRNRIGATLTSQTAEMLAPQSGVTTFAGNVLADNQDADSPQTDGAFGVGLAIAGGSGNQVHHNLIRDNSAAGVVVTDLDGFAPADNCVRENTLERNGSDLQMLQSGTKAFDGTSNGFGGNRFASSDPPSIEQAFPCAGAGTGAAASLNRFVPLTQPANADWRKIAPPPAQPSMPNPSPETRVPAKGQRTTVDPTSITTPRD